jgi:4'-phosphopantetheinyl transferase EntD
VLEEILPGSVVVESRRDDALDVTLFPEEREAVSRAVEKRVREFTTGRACAHAALARLGWPSQPVPIGARGAPQWPAGVVGSITHCDGYRACAVAREADLATVGVDAEPNQPLPPGLLPDIALPPERERLRGLMHDSPDVRWDRLLFCMKEAVYKAWFPLTESWLGFEDAEIEIDPSRGEFSARLLIPGPRLSGDGPLTGFAGRWLARDGLLLAAIAHSATVV